MDWKIRGRGWFLAGILLTGGWHLSAQSDQQVAELRYYSAQRDKLSLAGQVPAEVAKRLKLNGRTTYRYLMIQIQSPGKAGAVHLHPDKQGSFDVELLVTQGPGNYRLTFFGSQNDSGRLTGIAYVTVHARESYVFGDPELELGARIAAYLLDQRDRSIGRGECWDAAQSALDLHGAYWQRTFDYGQPLQPEQEELEPGDILQFRHLRLESRETDAGGRTRVRRYHLGDPDHTSIVIEVLAPGRYRVAHQNVNGVRRILVEELDLTMRRIGGSFRAYRPQAGLVYHHRVPGTQ
jgi:hypothetical protein